MKKLAALVLVVACGDNSSGDGLPPWLSDSKILVDGFDEKNLECRDKPCPHDENTDLIVFDGATYLVHRTAVSQILGPNSSLRVYKSPDHGATFDLLAIIPAPSDRDLRDPSFYVIDGKLAIKAITRLPVTSPRDSDVDSISVNTVSPDGGATWSDLTAIGPEEFSFWRIKDDSHGVHYSAAYEDGDKSVVLFSSTDGQAWTQGATIYGVSADTPLETELIFDFPGFPTDRLVALVRMDGTDDELLGNAGRLRTKVCISDPPYADFDCSQELDGVRLDGPLAFRAGDRELVVARKHFLDEADQKRTALFELTADDTGVLAITEHGELPSAGDTSYAGVAAIDDHRFVISYYSGNLTLDQDWALAILEPSDIWLGTVDVTKL